VIGNRPVRKTSILAKTVNCHALIPRVNPTVVGAMMLILQSFEGQETRLDFRDISRDKIYRPLVRICIRNSELVMLIFDLMRTSSFVAIEDCIMSMNSEAGNPVSFFAYRQKVGFGGQVGNHHTTEI
jgi:hypothetical protein